MTKRNNPIGPVGENVRLNMRKLRGHRTYQSVSEALEVAGRPIAPLGLRRIERGERHVDADDLVALAKVFGVSPVTLLSEPTEEHVVIAPAVDTELRRVIRRLIREELDAASVRVVTDEVFSERMVEMRDRLSQGMAALEAL